MLDETRTFSNRLNHDLVELCNLDDEDVEVLRRLIREHEEKTVSPRARNILVHWDEFLPQFRKVAPQGAAVEVTAIRTAYLSSPQVDNGTLLVRRSA